MKECRTTSNQPGETSTDSIFRTDIRFHYLDNLRALAMLAGIFFHTALAHVSAVDLVWFSAHPEKSEVLSFLVWFSHLFRMPIFFLIAGFFCVFLLEKRGLTGLLVNRARRVALPFIIFWPLIVLSFYAIIVWAISNPYVTSSIIEYFFLLGQNPDIEPPPMSTTHLWFLYYLCMFYLVFAIGWKLGIFGGAWLKRLANPKFVVFGLPLLVALSLIVNFAPHPAPEHLVPELWAFGFFGVFFIVGAALFYEESLIDRLAPYCPWLGGISLVAYVVVYNNFPVVDARSTEIFLEQFFQGVTITWQHVVMAMLESLIAVYMTVVCLVAGKLVLNRHNAIMRFISDSSYWIYLMHLPFLIFIQLFLMQFHLTAWGNFLLSSAATLFVGATSYLIFVRWTPIGWMLNGKKPVPQLFFNRKTNV